MKSQLHVMILSVIVGLYVSYSTAALAAVKSTENSVAKHYTDIAHAVFEDALTTAKDLDEKIDALVKSPNEKNLNAAKVAWKAARVPYQQSEVFRFGNANVDDWEGQLNAWPLDEGLIDYVATDYEHELGNAGSTANIVANKKLTVGSETLDLAKITPELLASLNELAGSEANVATGYHAVEFLLWGQDLNGTAAGAGKRPYTDFVQGKGCTNGNCERRAEYLQAAMDLLIADLEDMVAQWAPNDAKNYRSTFLALKSDEALTRMLYGMGSLSLGELAGERMKVALEANSPEDEHDCFSDNTHYSHFYNAKGVRNIYLGEYKRVDGSTLAGPSISDLVAKKDAAADKKLQAQLATTESKLQLMVDTAESKNNPIKFDQMIASGNKAGEKIVRDAIGSLVEQTGLIETAAASIGITNLNPDTADHTF
ncbi:MAG: imelysin family protein [Cellvibrionaceae bacterium]